jgi:Mrp family chromosome partitioning ATPase
VNELVVIPAGAPHPDPARLLYQITETNVIAELKSRFRNIVLDLPPMLDIAYSSLASRLAERILVVARYGETPTEDLERLIFLLGRERISGLVLNGTDFRTPGWLRRLL